MKDSSNNRRSQVALRQTLGISDPKVFVWERTLSYFYCGYFASAHHSAYLRLLEEASDRFFEHVGLAIPDTLRERRWVPVVHEHSIAIHEQAEMGERIYTTFRATKVLAKRLFSAKVSWLVLREGRPITVADGSIVHGYVEVEAVEWESRLVRFPSEVCERLEAWAAPAPAEAALSQQDGIVKRNEVIGAAQRRGRPSDAVKFYFSYRSPYAWLATLRIADVLAGLPVAVKLCPVWEPEPELVDRLKEHDLTWDFAQPSRTRRRYIFQDVRRFVQAYGLQFAWPIDGDVRWSAPHVGFLHARARGCEDAYHRLMFHRRFVHGEDITDPETIVRVGSEVGLNAEEMKEALLDGRYGAEVLSCFQEAASDDVFGWPFFVCGRRRYWGNDRLEWLADAIREDHALRRSPLPSLHSSQGAIGA